MTARARYIGANNKSDVLPSELRSEALPSELHSEARPSELQGQPRMHHFRANYKGEVLSSELQERGASE